MVTRPVLTHWRLSGRYCKSLYRRAWRQKKTDEQQTESRAKKEREPQMSYALMEDRPMTNEHGRHREVAGSEKRGHSASVRTGQRARTLAGLGLHLMRLLSVQC